MNNEQNIESGKLFALSLVLMNGLILTAIGGLFWIAQMIIANVSQFNSLAYRFQL